ncbi:MAG: hypothetical protein IT442_11665 [Phycisphaeraceae bacterium]|nr:hypothetical protein [Phycisphaeraceae bacterium]
MRLTVPTIILTAGLMAIAGHAAGQVAGQPDRWRLTDQTVQLPPADPRSMRILAARLGKPYASVNTLGGESRIYLPADGRVDARWGMVVWISPSNDDDLLSATYRRVFQRLRLIVITPLSAGNEAPVARRLSLALRCAEYAKKTYELDPQRFYIAGFSGGGRCASWLGVLYPDLFRGAMPICGCDYFRPMPVPNNPGKLWPADYRPPPGNLLRLAKKNVRFALLTAEHDANRLQTKTLYSQGFLRDRFEHVTYLEAPNLGHEPPLAGWLERGLAVMEGDREQK